MTDKDQRDARARMRVTGEKYTTALRWVRQARVATSPLPPSCREQRDVPGDELGWRGLPARAIRQINYEYQQVRAGILVLRPVNRSTTHSSRRS